MIMARWKGYVMSEETKRKIGLANTNQKWSLERRKTKSEQTKKYFLEHPEMKIQISKKQKGRKPWNTGIHRPEMTGFKHPNWKGGKTKWRDWIKETLEYKNWRKAIFKRDNYTCIHCGDNRGGNLNADHIKAVSEFPQLIFDINNGRTLCIPCHKKTDTWGWKQVNKLRLNIYGGRPKVGGIN